MARKSTTVKSSDMNASPAKTKQAVKGRAKNGLAAARCRRHADVSEQRARELRRVMGLSDVH